MDLKFSRELLEVAWLPILLATLASSGYLLLRIKFGTLWFADCVGAWIVFLMGAFLVELLVRWSAGNLELMFSGSYEGVFGFLIASAVSIPISTLLYYIFARLSSLTLS